MAVGNTAFEVGLELGGAAGDVPPAIGGLGRKQELHALAVNAVLRFQDAGFAERPQSHASSIRIGGSFIALPPAAIGALAGEDRLR